MATACILQRIRRSILPTGVHPPPRGPCLYASATTAPVSRVLPRDITNALLLSAYVACALLQLLALPLWLLPRDPAWGWILLPLGLLTPTQWALMHEAIHGNLFRSRPAGDAGGRLMGVLFGVPFRLLRVGHLLHHRHSRSTRERTEVYDPRTRSWAGAAAGYYPWLLGGLYVAEVALGLLMLLPGNPARVLSRRLDHPHSLAGPLLRGLAAADALREARVDAAGALALVLLAAHCYGSHAWMLAAALLLRAVVVSISDNAYHYGTAADRPRDAANLRLPAPARALLLHFTLHGVHHRHPALPWHALPAAFAADGDRWQAHYAVALLRQLRGPLPLGALPQAARDD